MINFLSMFGIPDCNGDQGRCKGPGIVEVELDGPAGPLTAKLCPFCASMIAQCHAEMEALHREAQAIEEPAPPAGYLP